MYYLPDGYETSDPAYKPLTRIQSFVVGISDRYPRLALWLGRFVGL